MPSPLTGLVIEICVERGERVERGQTLMVVEAMKMENRISAPCDGDILEFHGNVGNLIRCGELLAVLSPE